MANRSMHTPPITRTIREDAPSRIWDAITESVGSGRDEVIVETEGKPSVAIISLVEYASLRKTRQQQRRAQTIARLEAIAQDVGDRNMDLSEADVEELAQRFSQEFYEDLEVEGKIAFEKAASE